jgi:flavin-dependent dehydrogenase
LTGAHPNGHANLAFAARAGGWRSLKLLGVLERDEWDVAVVGGGPAGLAAASAAAAAGARTIVLERAEHPRYKTCGGGLIGASRAAAGSLISVPARDEINSATVTLRGGQEFTRSHREPLLAMVVRDGSTRRC